MSTIILYCVNFFPTYEDVPILSEELKYVLSQNHTCGGSSSLSLQRCGEKSQLPGHWEQREGRTDGLINHLSLARVQGTGSGGMGMRSWEPAQCSKMP